MQQGLSHARRLGDLDSQQGLVNLGPQLPNRLRKGIRACILSHNPHAHAVERATSRTIVVDTTGIITLIARYTVMRCPGAIALSLLCGLVFFPQSSHAAIRSSLHVSVAAILPQVRQRDSALPKEPPSRLSQFKDAADGLHSVATIIALMVGGWWTYTRFVKNRGNFPRAKLSHAITQRDLGSGFRLIHVATTITNSGTTLLKLCSGFTQILQIVPADEDVMKALREQKESSNEKMAAEFDWPGAGRREFSWKDSPRELEPGEDETVECDFALEADIKTISVYTFFQNERKLPSKIGWHLSTFCDLSSEPPVSSASQISGEKPVDDDDRGGKQHESAQTTKKQAEAQNEEGQP